MMLLHLVAAVQVLRSRKSIKWVEDNDDGNFGFIFMRIHAPIVWDIFLFFT